ncbi:MAG: AAA family ATPase [Bacteroidales bacterium]|nr:AAA family ATPase [Bacteroidales bacterium]
MSDDKTPLSQQPVGDLPASIAPIEAINQEAEELLHAPDIVGCLKKRTMNEWVDDSLTKPKPRAFCRESIVEFEITVVFASAGIGKTIACVGMAEDIARETGEEVNYLDFELSENHLRDRYVDSETGTKHVFPPTLNRFEFSADNLGNMDIEDAILASIEIEARRGVKYHFVDNLTYICRDSEKGLTAGEFMKELRTLRQKYNLTMVIVAHTPKRDMSRPLTEYDLAGSSKLINFFDAAIAIGRSAKDSELRYLKQVKTRTGAELYGADNVMVCRLEQTNGFTHFEFIECGKEREHLREDNFDMEMEEINQIVSLCGQKKSQRQIGEETGLSAATINRRIKKAKKLGLLDENGMPVSPVSEETDVKQEKQPETPETPAQPDLFEKEDSHE